MKPRLSHRITGLGILSAAGSGVEDTWRTLTGEPPGGLDESEKLFHKLKVPTEIYHELDLREDTSVANVYALIATLEAVRSAGLVKRDFESLRVGVCIGSTMGCSNYQDGFLRRYFRGEHPTPEALFDFFNSNTAQFLARYLGARGPVQMVSNACTSGADAIGVGATWLNAGVCDVVICGGTESIVPAIYQGFKSLLLCSSGPCRPFDQLRSGLMLGEGAGIVVLETNSTSRRSLAHLHGFGWACEAFHPTAPDPEGRGLGHAARMAVGSEGLSKIDFINAHGTATIHNDLAEGRWIKSHVESARVVATKGYTGHTLGAAGAIEAVMTSLSLIQQKLPPSKGFSDMDPNIGFAPTQQLESGRYERALSLSLGFGGTNTVLWLGRAHD